MTRIIGAVLIVCLATLLVAAPALAQARDPFRAPGGQSGEEGPGPAAPNGDGDAAVPPSSGGLPRTGLDLMLPVAAAVALMVAGAGMRLAGRALAL